MKIIKSLRRKSLMFLLLTVVIVSSIPLESKYATATDDLPKSENPYHVEILPSEDNSYEGETQANFMVKVTYSGVDVIPKETIYRCRITPEKEKLFWLTFGQPGVARA